MKPFFILAILLVLILWLICVACVNLNLIPILPTFLPEILIFVGLSTAAMFVYLYRVGAEQFVPVYLLTMVVKLIAYGGFTVFMILEDRPNAALNTGFFLVAYLLFTLLEMRFLYPKINR